MKVFVYGTLKQGFGNHRLLADATYLGKAVTTLPCKLAGYGVPFVWPHADGLPVQGEVYEIGDPETNQLARNRLTRLDRLESNGYVYDRKPHQVTLLDGGEAHEAWLYEAMPHVANDYSRDHDFTEQMLRYVNDAGYLEWQYNPRPRPVHPAENIGSTTRDRRARPLGEVLNEGE